MSVQRRSMTARVGRKQPQKKMAAWRHADMSCCHRRGMFISYHEKRLAADKARRHGMAKMTFTNMARSLPWRPCCWAEKKNGMRHVGDISAPLGVPEGVGEIVMTAGVG